MSYSEDLQYVKIVKNIDDFLNDFNLVRPKIYFQIVNKEKCVDKADTIPTVDFCDLSMVFKVMIEETDGDMMSALVTYDLMNRWNIDKQTLVDIAMENTEQMFPIEIKTLSGIVMEMADVKGVPDMGNMEPYVITNTKFFNGFGAVFYYDILCMLNVMLGKFYILPSSVHEAIVIPEGMSADIDQYYHMVCGINKMLAPNDKLSDNVYWYDADALKLVAYK